MFFRVLGKSHMERFSQRVGLVTGGSEGIGFAIAQRLIGEGATVYICGRRAEALNVLKSSWAKRYTPASSTWPTPMRLLR